MTTVYRIIALALIPFALMQLPEAIGELIEEILSIIRFFSN